MLSIDFAKQQLKEKVWCSDCWLGWLHLF